MLFALQLNITIEDKDATPLYRTQIQILKGEEVLATKNAELIKVLGQKDVAQANFSLDPGVYFVKLTRSSYPEHVNLIEVSKDSKINLVMLLTMPTYNLYGQILDEDVGSWVGKPIYVIDNTDAKLRESKVMAGGYYILNSLYPGVKYRIKVGDGEERQISAPFSYDRPGAFYVPMDLRESTVFVSENPVLSAPASASLHDMLKAYLRSGSKVLANETIFISTPVGIIEAATDSNGMVQVQAAGYGAYTFVWKNLSTSTNVLAPVKEEPKQEPEELQTQPEQEAPVISANQSSASQSSSNSLFFGIGMAGLILLCAVFLGIIVVGIIAYFLLSRQKHDGKKGKKQKE